MMPSMTSGVHSKPSSTPVWKVQAGISRATFLVLICFRGL